MAKGKAYRADVAARIATRLAAMLDYSCEHIDVCGSLRRGRQKVHDIDLVVVPKLTEIPPAQGGLFDGGKPTYEWDGKRKLDLMVGGMTLFELFPHAMKGTIAHQVEKDLQSFTLKRETDGPKSWECGMVKYRAKSASPQEPGWVGIPIDVYVCSVDRYPLVRLIRTGSKEHNIRLAEQAKKLGMRLHADGTGITDPDGNLIEITSEKQAFRLLGLKYRPPEKRDKKSKR